MQALRLLDWRPVWSRGELARGGCPVHGSRSRNSRSFVVSVEVCYCHKCHWTGDAVELWARVKGLPKLEAAYDLCNRLGVNPPAVVN